MATPARYSNIAILSLITAGFMLQSATATEINGPAVEIQLPVPGDDRAGYEKIDYTSKSQQIVTGNGQPVDLLGVFNNPPLGLGTPPVPLHNRLTRAKIELGRKLFFDRRLSFNGTLSCAMCHIPEQGFTQNEIATPVGFEGRFVNRNAPTLYNVAYRKFLFHDGREISLERQVWGPLLKSNEMANPSIQHVVQKIKQLEDYATKFNAAFGLEPDMQTIGMALASYERALLSADSSFDRWYFGGDEHSMTEVSRRGFALFVATGCSNCHRLGEESAQFTDEDFHATGVGFHRSVTDVTSVGRLVQIAPGVEIWTREGFESTGYKKNQASDFGRFQATNNPEDRWKFKTPTLRNVALTAPYMHDGSLRTLMQVIDFYNRGGVRHAGIDSLIKPLGLSPVQKQELHAFLTSLTGSNVVQLARDARVSGIGDY